MKKPFARTKNPAFFGRNAAGCMFCLAGGGGRFVRRGRRERVPVAVRKGGNAPPAHIGNKGVQGGAQPDHPYRFGQQEGGEGQPVGGDGGVGALAAQEHDDGGNDERIEQNGEDSAQPHLRRGGALARIFAQGNADKIGADGGGKGGERADRQVVEQKGGGEVRQQAPHVQRGDRLGKEEGQKGERLARPDLKDAERNGCEGVGERHVQRGDDARAADALGGENVPEHEKTSVFLFGSVDRKPSVAIYYRRICRVRQAFFSADGASGGRRSART